jgi:non-ribosomal peptide synthetase component F
MLHNAPEGPTEGFAGVEARGAGSDQGSAKADLSLVLSETPDGRFAGALEYATDLFDAATARRLAEHLRTLVRSAAASPDAPVSTLALMGREERAALVAAGSATAAFPVTRPLHALFAEQAARTPNAVALTFGGESVAYAELDARANRLAHRLVKLGARPGSLVGLCVERSVETVVGILAILKAGAAYLPLDPAYPEDRLAYLLEDSGAPMVVADGGPPRPVRFRGVTVVCLQCDAKAIAAEPSDRRPSTSLPIPLRTSSTPRDRRGSRRGCRSRTPTSPASSRRPTTGSASAPRTCGRSSTPTPSTSRCGRCGARCCTAAASWSSPSTSPARRRSSTRCWRRRA